MPTKKSAKAAEAEETKPKKTAAKKAVKEKAEAEPKAKAVKKAKAPEPEAIEAPAKKAPVKKAAKAEAASLTPHAATILAAIDEGRAVEFIFEDAEANAPRTFEPRQLIFDTLSKAWFAWGWDRRYNAERFHRLDLL